MNQQPADNRVGDGNLVNVAPLQLRKERRFRSWLRDDGGRYRQLQFLAECSEARIIFVSENEGRD